MDISNLNRKTTSPRQTEINSNTMASLLDTVAKAINTQTIQKKVKRSAEWFRNKIRELSGEAKNRLSSATPEKFYRDSENKVLTTEFKKRVSIGDLFCYFYDPKYKKTLPYYDMFPLIMLIDADADTFLGLNFHYLPPRFRARLLDKVSAVGKNQNLNFRKIARIPEVAPTVKRYRYDHVQRRVIEIKEEENELVIFLPLEKFAKETKSKVWADSKKRL